MNHHKKNLLFISTCPIPIDKGSDLHAYNFLKVLSSIFHVYCIFFIPHHKEKPSVQDIKNLKFPIKSYNFCHFNNINKSNQYISFVSQTIAYPNRFMNAATNKKSLKLIQSYLNEYRIDIVHIEHFWYAKYIFYIPKNIKKVIVYHDLHHSIFSQKSVYEDKYNAKIRLKFECLKFYLFEKSLDKHLDMKVFLNQDEMKALPNKSVYIPHVANSDITYRESRKTARYNILFLGSYSHPPNRVALEYTINELLPKLIEKTEKFTFHVVGKGTELFNKKIEHFSYKHLIKIQGFKEDINDVFKNMDIALFPVLYGGGIKTKIIDSMAAGVPVVTTPQGISGLDSLPSDCIGVGDSEEELINEILLLMNSFTIRSERAERCKNYINDIYSYSSFYKQVLKYYKKL